MEYLTLQNEKGEEISVRFRPFRPEDAAAVVHCIKDEYGDRYHKKNMYDEDYIIRQNREGQLFTHVAELKDGQVIGTLSIARHLPDDTSGSISTGIILKPYRGFKMFFPLAKYIAGKMRKLPDISAVYCRLFLYHDITQKLMYRLGLQPCALMSSLILAKNFCHSYGLTETGKITLGILIRRREKKKAGIIYLPPEHEKIARHIYDSLRLKYELSVDGEELKGESNIAFSNDPVHASGTLTIDAPGQDLAAKLKEIHEGNQAPYQTFNAFLNISDSRATAAYKVLQEAGYLFTGFKPICGKNEYMLLHYPGEVTIDFGALKLIPAFEELRNYVHKCYNEIIDKRKQVNY